MSRLKAQPVVINKSIKRFVKPWFRNDFFNVKKNGYIDD